MIRLAIPAHLFAALLFLGGQLGVRHDAGHGRGPKKKDREKRSENGSARHGSNLTLFYRPPATILQQIRRTCRWKDANHFELSLIKMS